MANATPIAIRLREEELKMLAHICKSKDRGDYNQSELIRLLIRREYLRRTKGTSKVEHSDIATDFRMGQPKHR